MTLKRMILEMGTGNDLYGEDYTKAAVRAVQDALHHSSLTMFRSLDLDPDLMEITVRIGVAKPAAIDRAKVAAQLPFGQVDVAPVIGGMNVDDPENGILTVIATAAIEVFYPVPDGRWRLA